MIVHQLYLLPSPETLDYIRQRMSPPPFDINFDRMGVLLYTSAEPMEACDATYVAYSRKLERVYNSELERSNWVMTLQSDAMVQRYKEAITQAPDLFYKECFPHMNLVEGLPQATQSVRSFRISMENIFTDLKTPLTFGNELVITKDISYSPDYDYQQLKLMEMSRGFDRIDL